MLSVSSKINLNCPSTMDSDMQDPMLCQRKGMQVENTPIRVWMRFHQKIIVSKMGLDAVLVATTIISIFINEIRTTDVDSKYVIVDGIKVLRADYEAFSRAEEKKKVQDALKKAKEDLMTKEYRLQEEESEEYAKRFPKRCHVCKIFVEELTEVLERNFTKSKSGEFPITTLEFYDAMDETCENMDKYTVTRVNSFRYKKGGRKLITPH
ncbi:uncharacterized protein [Clytia hemisphaerica]|uniref:uncharacterized protein n=1 Tax=Clytia hemisphaerica TaxID=252671 RepID=UPI0034D3B124